MRSLAASHLFAGSKEERLAAIRALGTATDPQVKSLLDEFRYSANLDPELYKAAGEALASIDSRLRWTGIDFRRDAAGRWCFLEANPCPMFLRFERDTGHKVLCALVDELLG